MSEGAFIAPPMRKAEIEAAAWAVRQLLDFDDPYLDVPALLEHGLHVVVPGFTFDVRTRLEMGTRHGFVDPARKLLALREDVYEGLINGAGRDRFTTCHEIGHALMHGRTLNRLAPGTKAATYCDPEWQANTFASAILMPEAMVRTMNTLAEVQSEFGVSFDAARVRAEKLGLRLPKC